jgi:hypothetical protein
MTIELARVGYLASASGRLGPIAETHIEQRGVSIAALARPFRLLDHSSLAALRG